MTQLLSATPSDSITARVAGPNVLLSRVPTTTRGPGNLVVLDRAGKQIGSGAFTPIDFAADVYGSPTGTQWAWSVDDTPTLPDAHHGRIMVAGLSTPAHSVYSWAAPSGSFDEHVAAWTDMGIVMERIGEGGCGVGFHPDTASFLIDPVAGTLTDLFTNGDHYADVSHNVRVALSATSAMTLFVNGTAIVAPNAVVNAAYVSPDGARVGLQLFSLGGCAGGPPPSLLTEILDVAAGTHTNVTGCGIDGWLDTTHFACHAWNTTAEKLDSLDGSSSVALGSGVFVGAVSG